MEQFKFHSNWGNSLSEDWPLFIYLYIFFGFVFFNNVSTSRWTITWYHSISFHFFSFTHLSFSVHCSTQICLHFEFMKDSNANQSIYLNKIITKWNLIIRLLFLSIGIHASKQKQKNNNFRLKCISFHLFGAFLAFNCA